MKRFYFLLLAFFSQKLVSPQDLNYFVRSVMEFYTSRSLVVVLGGSICESEIFELLKFLRSDENMYFCSAMTIKQFLKMIKLGYHNDKKTVVIADYSEELFNESFAKLSHDLDISVYKWLVMAPSLNMKKFELINIPIVSEFVIANGNVSINYTLTEIYNVDSSRKLTQSTGVWFSRNKSLIRLSSPDLFERRKNLRKRIIKIVSPHPYPCAEASFAFGVGGIVVCIHYHLWGAIAEMLRARSVPVIIPSMNVSTIEHVDADLMLRSAPMNLNDFKTRSYIWPIFASKLVVLSRYAGQEVDWKTYIKPFNKQMWLMILIWIVVCDSFLLVAEFVSFFLNNKQKNPLFNYYTKYSFLSFFAFCNQGLSETPKSISLRLILFAVFLVPTVLVPGYSAELTSFITVQLPKMPFRNIEELSWLKDYSLGWHYTFPTKLMFNMNDTTPVYQRLLANNVLPDEKMPRTDIEAVERVCKNKFAYICDVSTIIALKPNCKYFKLDHPFLTVFNSMEVKKNNPLGFFFDRCERQLQFSGVQRRIVVQAVINDIPNLLAVDKFQDKVSPIMIENGALPFVLLFASIALSLFIFLLEVFWFYWKTHKPPYLLQIKQ